MNLGKFLIALLLIASSSVMAKTPSTIPVKLSKVNNRSFLGKSFMAMTNITLTNYYNVQYYGKIYIGEDN